MTKYAVQLNHSGFGFAGYICEEIDGVAVAYSSDTAQALRVSLELAETLKEKYVPCQVVFRRNHTRVPDRGYINIGGNNNE